MMKNIAIAIDGPAAAGKSTIAKIIAERLGYIYIDTGAMYRSVTWYALSKGVDCQDEKAVCNLLPEISIILQQDGKVFCNGEDVTKAIRTTEVAQNVSYVASYKEVRLALVKLQRKMAESVSVVMDGRDIGTYVLPNAQVKIFQVASVAERAKRRYEENIQKGISCQLAQIEEELRKRDYIDSNRAFAPLTPAKDSILLDTSDLGIEEVAQKVISIIKERIGEQNE